MITLRFDLRAIPQPQRAAAVGDYWRAVKTLLARRFPAAEGFVSAAEDDPALSDQQDRREFYGTVRIRLGWFEYLWANVLWFPQFDDSEEEGDESTGAGSFLLHVARGSSARETIHTIAVWGAILAFLLIFGTLAVASRYGEQTAVSMLSPVFALFVAVFFGVLLNVKGRAKTEHEQAEAPESPLSTSRVDELVRRLELLWDEATLSGSLGVPSQI